MFGMGQGVVHYLSKSFPEATGSQGSRCLQKCRMNISKFLFSSESSEVDRVVVIVTGHENLEL